MRIEQLRFSSGAAKDTPALAVKPGRITLFIGPNTGGKSQALRDIASKFTGHFSGVVLSGIDLPAFSDSDLETKLSWLSRPKLPGEDPDPNKVAVGKRGNYQIIDKNSLRSLAVQEKHYHVYAQWFLQYLIMNLNGESRLQLTAPMPSVHIRQPPNSTISLLLRNDSLRARLSNLVFEAFGQHLVIDPTAMSQVQYALSSEKPSPDVERSFTEESAQFFEKSQPLNAASFGTKAFVGIMSEVMAGDHEVLLIDEPEAFLHPSLAYFLGKEISKNLDDSKQLFAATHSPHFMMGCVDSGVAVDIIRLTHTPTISTARSLPKADLKTITTDPLLKSIGVTSALFYQEAVVCEADADRAFYAEIASRLGDKVGFRHTVFLNGHGKHTMPGIVEALRVLGIPTVGIMDLDWIKEDGTVAENYMTGFGVPAGMKDAAKAARKSTRTALEKADPNYKRSGGLGVLSGDDARSAQDFTRIMRSYGIFTVENGEIEQWLPTLKVSRNKTKWLQEIFFAIGSDPKAGDYVHASDDDVWQFLAEIGSWLAASKS